MRALGLVGLLLASPVNAADYQVTTNAAPFGEQPSSFREIDFPASHFIEKSQESSGSFSSEASSFDLKPMDEETRALTIVRDTGRNGAEESPDRRPYGFQRQR